MHGYHSLLVAKLSLMRDVVGGHVFNRNRVGCNSWHTEDLQVPDMTVVLNWRRIITTILLWAYLAAVLSPSPLKVDVSDVVDGPHLQWGNIEFSTIVIERWEHIANGELVSSIAKEYRCYNALATNLYL